MGLYYFAIYSILLIIAGFSVGVNLYYIIINLSINEGNKNNG